MAIDWKKVSEHPLPRCNYDEQKMFLVQYYNAPNNIHIEQFPKAKEITHWAEVNPPEPDKEPEIALWSVWESNTAKKLKIVFNTDDGRVLIYDPILATRNNFDRTGFLKFHKPRPDLEVLAPRLKKSVLTGEVYFDTTYYPKLIKKDGGTYKWPAELGQMIVVPKEGV